VHGFIHKKTKQLLARKRDGTENLVPLNVATMVLEFYDIGNGQTPDITLEDWFVNKHRVTRRRDYGRASLTGARTATPARLTFDLGATLVDIRARVTRSCETHGVLALQASLTRNRAWRRLVLAVRLVAREVPADRDSRPAF
jgi:hypothetical protein